MDDINITTPPTDNPKIPETDPYIYNPSSASSESITSYKTERTINSRKSRYNALPRHKYAGVGLPNGLVSLGVDVQADAGPSQTVMQNPILVDSEAGAEARRRLGTELKPKFTTLVEYMYNFNTSQARASVIYNAGRAQELLRDMNFIYPEPRTGHDPYRHPIIQRMVNTTWFRDKDDIGVVDHEQFSPMPIPIIAITLTVIEWCIGEWSGGTRRESNWDDAKFQTVYDSHSVSLREFRSASLPQLQSDLLWNAREHAGVAQGLRVFEDEIIFAREERGDQWLRDARKLAGIYGASFRPSDLEIVNEKITLATEIKVGLESKKGLRRYLQAREYRKATKETLKFVKLLSDQPVHLQELHRRDPKPNLYIYSNSMREAPCLNAGRARDERAGVRPDSATALSRLPLGALEVIREEDNQPSPPYNP